MVDLSGEQESDKSAHHGIEHMQLYKERLTERGRNAPHGRYKESAKPDMLVMMGGMIVADSHKVRVTTLSNPCIKPPLCKGYTVCRSCRRTMNCSCSASRTMPLITGPYQYVPRP